MRRLLGGGLGFRELTALARMSSAERRRLARQDGWILAGCFVAFGASFAAGGSMAVWFVQAGLPADLAGELAVGLATLGLIGAVAALLATRAMREWRVLWRLEEELMEAVR